MDGFDPHALDEQKRPILRAYDPTQVCFAPTWRPPDDLRRGEVLTYRKRWLMGCPFCGAVMEISAGTTYLIDGKGRITIHGSLSCPNVPRCGRSFIIRAGKANQFRR